MSWIYVVVAYFGFFVRGSWERLKNGFFNYKQKNVEELKNALLTHAMMKVFKEKIDHTNFVYKDYDGTGLPPMGGYGIFPIDLTNNLVPSMYGQLNYNIDGQSVLGSHHIKIAHLLGLHYQGMVYKTDFDLTKENIIGLTHYLDKVEELYNNTLKEYQSRTNG